MRRLLSIALAGALVLTLTGTTLAAKGGNSASSSSGGGKNTASITLMAPAGLSALPPTWPAVGDSVSFAVTAGVKTSDVYDLWVANWCYQDGVAVYAQFLPVQNWAAGPFTLSWSGGSVACTAYVFLFPDTNSPLSGGSITYSVSG